MPATVISLGNSLLSGKPAISITLVSIGTLDYARQLIHETRKEKKKESHGCKRKIYRPAIWGVNCLLFGSYLVCAVVSATTKVDLRKADVYFSWISPLFLLFSRVFHKCLFSQNNQEKADDFVRDVPARSLESIMVLSQVKCLKGEQEKKLFTKGKYLFFRFFNPGENFKLGTKEDKEEVGLLLQGLYEAAECRFKQLGKEAEDEEKIEQQELENRNLRGGDAGSLILSKIAPGTHICETDTSYLRTTPILENNERKDLCHMKTETAIKA